MDYSITCKRPLKTELKIIIGLIWDVIYSYYVE